MTKLTELKVKKYRYLNTVGLNVFTFFSHVIKSITHSKQFDQGLKAANLRSMSSSITRISVFISLIQIIPTVPAVFLLIKPLQSALSHVLDRLLTSGRSCAIINDWLLLSDAGKVELPSIKLSNVWSNNQGAVIQKAQLRPGIYSPLCDQKEKAFALFSYKSLRQYNRKVFLHDSCFEKCLFFCVFHFLQWQMCLSFHQTSDLKYVPLIKLWNYLLHARKFWQIYRQYKWENHFNFFNRLYLLTWL